MRDTVALREAAVLAILDDAEERDEDTIITARRIAALAVSPTTPDNFRTVPMKDGIRYDSRGEPIRDTPPTTTDGLREDGHPSLRETVVSAVTNHLRTGCEDTPKEACAEAIWSDIEGRLS